MEALEHLASGFAVALTPANLLYCLLGCLWGTVVGILPGLGPLAGLTLLLPLTYKLEPASAVIMLAGIFYGAMYGGSTTSILLRIPGEAASIMTCIDGYEMARRGRAGPALVVAGIGSFVGGTASVIGLMFFAPPLAQLMLKVGPAAEFALMALALVVMGFISPGPVAKTIAMMALGLAIATIGLDPIVGFPRFTFGQIQLTEGLSFVAMALGLFGVSEILLNLEDVVKVRPIRPTFASLVPRAADLRASAPAIGRGTVIGFVFGFVPGISHVVSTFVSYAVERKLARNPQEFGQGAIAGVAGPETANNATTGSAMIPLLVLGIPAIPATAILLSALMIHGVNPGPQLVVEHPQVFWGLIASMYVGNLVLLVLNLPMVGVWVKLLKVPYRWLFPSIIMFCCVGNYSLNNSPMDLYVCAVIGFLGYILVKLECEPAPLMLGYVLGPLMEENLRRALLISRGDPMVFFTRPISLTFMVLAFAVLFMMVAPAMRRKRSEVYQEAG